MRKGYEKRFNHGDIVYWCHQNGCKYSVHFGMVDEQFSDAVVIDYLVPKERRVVNGIPIDKFESEQRFKKLPKGWSYDTKLYEMSSSPMTKEESEFLLDITKPESVKEAYDKGYLVKDCTIFHGRIEAEITKDGYRIVKTYPMWEHHIDHVSVMPHKVYFTYNEAFEEVEAKKNELIRQSKLTDLEWLIEQIDKQLNRWKTISDCSDLEIQSYREFLLAQKYIEDIEVRIGQSGLQWKYWNKKRWNYIEI